jgi:glycosyltransferase involved in cell wall biosynthesis
VLSIAVDGCVFENSSQRGIQRYFHELLSRVAWSQEVVIGLDKPALSATPPGSAIAGPVYTGPLRRWDLAGRFLTRLRARATWRAFERCDVFHSTYFSRGPKNLPSVVTVHDMIPEQFPQWFWDFDALIEQKRSALESAKKIIAISHATADELLAFYPWCEGRVRVVYHGSDHLTSYTEHEGPNRSEIEKYVLFVGDRIRYKNLQVVLGAMNEKSWPSGLKLRVVGTEFTPGEQLLIGRMRLTDRVEHKGSVNDAELAKLFFEAFAFVFPSFSEGFGFPLLEAQRCRCPVICSDLPVFREVAGESALFADPLCPANWAGGIQSLVDPGRRVELIQGGLVNESRFRWDKTAAQTIEVYADAVGKTGKG